MAREKVSQYGIQEESRSTAGVAYIYIPEDFERDKFVRNAIRTGHVSILMSQSSERVDNCRVAKHVMNDLEFPAESGGQGSLVLWVNLPKHELPMIVGVINKFDDIAAQFEHEFYLKRKIAGSNVEIVGNAKNKILTLTVDAGVDASIVIKSSGSIKVQSPSVNVSATTVNAQCNSLVANAVNDATLKSKHVLVNSEDVKFKDASEKIALGETVKSIVDDLLDALASTTVATAIGAQPLSSVATMIQLRAKTEAILSKHVKSS